MAKVTSNLQIDAGADYNKKWRRLSRDESTGNSVPIPMAGWSGRCSVRERPGPAGYLLVDSLSIVLGATDGTVTLEIPGTTSWAWKFERGFYDILLSHPTESDVRFAEGYVNVRPGVTAP